MPDRSEDYRDDDEVQADLAHRIRTEGGLVAYETCLAACRAETASWNARTHAARSILDAGGYFKAAAQEDPTEKDPSTMTAAEIADALARLKSPKMPDAPKISGKRKISKAKGGAFD